MIPQIPLTSNWFAARAPGILRNGDALRPIQNTRNAREVRACQAYGTGSTTITSATTLPLTTAVQDTDETESATWLATLASNALTLKRAGFFIAEFTAIIGYSTSSGSSGATMKEAKVSAWINAGGNIMAASLNKETLSSRRNTSALVTAPGDVEQAVEIGGATGKTSAFTADSFVVCDPVPTATNTYAYDTLGISEVFTTIHPTCANALTDEGLDGDGKMALALDSPQSIDVSTNIERIADYAPALFQEKTITGKVLIQVVPVDAETYKVRIAGTNYDGVLKVEASVTYGGDGTDDPVAVCTACTLTLLRI